MYYIHSKTNVKVILNGDDGRYFKSKEPLFHNYVVSRYIENDVTHFITRSQMFQLKLCWDLHFNNSLLDNQDIIDKFIHLLGEFIRFGEEMTTEELHKDAIFRIVTV